jgi:hypothetical protein
MDEVQAPELFTTIPIQTTYSDTMPPGAHGQPATMVNWDADTKIVAASQTTGIGFGLAVSLSLEKQIVKGGSAYCGVTYRDITQIATGTLVDVYPPGWNAGVCRRGDIWLVSAVAIAVTDPVTYATATGVISKDAVAGGFVAIPNAKWMRGCGANGVALLRLEP